MWTNSDYIIAHCKRVYGMRIFYKNRKIYVNTSNDTYLLDMSLANYDVYRFRSTTRPFTLTETCLPRGFFRVAAYETYKEAKIIPTNKDWETFVNNAYKHEIFMEELK